MLVPWRSAFTPAAHARRRWLSSFMGLAIILAGAVPVGAQVEPANQVQPLDGPVWALALERVSLRSQPDDGGLAFGTLRPLAPLKILGYAGDWAYVYNPRSRGTAYVKAEKLGPGDAPSAYAEMEPPPVEQELERQGRLQE